MATTDWFAECQTLDEARLEYRRLCFEHHPDRGGTTTMMQAINVAYERWKADRQRTRAATPPGRSAWQRPRRERPAYVAPERSAPAPEPEPTPLHSRADIEQRWAAAPWQPQAGGNVLRALLGHRVMLVRHPAPKYKGAWFVLFDDVFSPYFYDNRLDAEHAALELLYDKVKFQPL